MVAFYVGSLIDTELRTVKGIHGKMSKDMAKDILNELGITSKVHLRGGALAVEDVKRLTVAWLRKHIGKPPGYLNRLIHELAVAADDKRGTHIFWG